MPEREEAPAATTNPTLRPRTDRSLPVTIPPPDTIPSIDTDNLAAVVDPPSIDADAPLAAAGCHCRCRTDAREMNGAQDAIVVAPDMASSAAIVVVSSRRARLSDETSRDASARRVFD